MWRITSRLVSLLTDLHRRQWKEPLKPLARVCGHLGIKQQRAIGTLQEGHRFKVSDLHSLHPTQTWCKAAGLEHMGWGRGGQNFHGL